MGRTTEQKRELVNVLTEETARIMKTGQIKGKNFDLRSFKRKLVKCRSIGDGYGIGSTLNNSVYHYLGLASRPN